MKLLTKAEERKLPPLQSQDGKGREALAVLKFFDPCSQWTWYVSEASVIMNDGTEKSFADYREFENRGGDVLDDPDVEDVRFFGLVIGFENEFGYFSLRELVQVRGSLGLPLERDIHFAAMSLAECALLYLGAQS